ncbi:MAG: sialidase family protein [Acidobacteriota bacterium]
MRRIALLVLAGLTLTVMAASAQQPTIVQASGVDSRVDYTELTKFGPWDDRNYDLTREDLALLSDNEADLAFAVPAFYRVEMRRNYELMTTGPAQYPRSSLPYFKLEYGGYLVNGKLHQSAERNLETKQWTLNLDDVVEQSDYFAAKRAYESLDGDVRVTTPAGGAESSITINHTDSDQVIVGSNGPSGGQRMWYSNDGGASWTAAAALPLGGTCCDPTIDFSFDGSLAYVAALGGGRNYFYRSADNGQTWDDLANEPGNDPRREIGSGTDKEFIHVDRFATSPHLDNIYMTWHEGNVMHIATSDDFGNTWSEVNFPAEPRGIGGDITSDRSGNLYHCYPAFTPRDILLQTSTNGGSTWSATSKIDDTNGSFIFPVPSSFTRQVFIYCSIDADVSDGPYSNSIYAAWTDHDNATTSGTAANNHAVIRVAYSRDGGTTWTTTTPHEIDDVDSVDRWHQWLTVAENGDVYVGFYDTRDGVRSSVDFYYSVSTDGAQTWSDPVRMTSESSPRVSNGGFEFGDYNGMHIIDGQLISVFTDSRDEAGGSSFSVDIYAAGVSGLGALEEIFSDSFESGDTSAWSSTVP